MSGWLYQNREELRTRSTKEAVNNFFDTVFARSELPISIFIADLNSGDPEERYPHGIFREWPKSIATVDISSQLNEEQHFLPEKIRSMNAIQEGKYISYCGISMNFTITFKDCFIFHLYLRGPARVVLENCYVGILECVTVNDLRITGGALISVRAVPFQQTDASVSPFKGRVTMSEVYIPRDEVEAPNFLYVANESQNTAKRHKMIYEYRNFRSWLSLQNLSAVAGIFQAAELALSRKSEPAVTKGLNFIYEIISDYGNSIGRPFKWIIAIYAVFAALIYFADSVEVRGCGISPPTFQMPSLFQIDLCYNSFYVPLLYPIFTILNPLNLFQNAATIVPKSVGFSILHAFLSICGITSVAAFALAVRRKFKLESF
jgi:hypothetical protein